MVAPAQDQSRRARLRAPAAGRHRGAEASEDFSGSFAALGALAYSGARVSAHVIDLGSGTTLFAADDRVVLPTAGIGRILLLIEVSARLSGGDYSGLGILDKTTTDAAAGAGLWRHLQAPALPAVDLAALIGASADSLATNTLLQQIGLDAVRARAESLGLSHIALLDRVRDRRGPDDAPHVSVGSTAELAGLFAALARDQVVDAPTSRRVLGWLSLGYDLSGVASAFGLDPLSHRSPDAGFQVINCTGTTAGVRSEAGILYGPKAAASYAVTVTFDEAGLAARLRAIDAMRRVGYDLLEHVS
ncbi:MAG TPA: serine hydrolase [Microbacteriaceae bacterium]